MRTLVLRSELTVTIVFIIIYSVNTNGRAMGAQEIKFNSLNSGFLSDKN